MKRWTRPVLAILLLGLAAGYLAVGPAQAVKPDRAETVVTYRGYTVSWSGSDPSDFRVIKTPGRAESFPAAASDRSIQQAKARVAHASVQQASEDPTDACTLVPDIVGLANFGPACALHDLCYSRASNVDRLECDLILLRNLTIACAAAYPTDLLGRLTCNTVAVIYFVGVRLFGGFAYFGTGNPA